MKSKVLRRALVAAAFALAAGSSSSLGARAAAPAQQPAVPAPAASPKSAERALLDQYCVSCHNQRAKTAGVGRVVFDRGGFLYHGRVAALADAAREAGLEF